MGKKIRTILVDVGAGFVGTALVTVATDATGVDLRIQFLASVAIFFAIGLWRGRVAHLPAALRVGAVGATTVILGLLPIIRHWPPEAALWYYTALFVLLPLGAVAAGFSLSRGRTLTRDASVGVFAAVSVLAAAIGWITMPAFSRALSFDESVRPAPEVRLETLAGETVHSTNWRGKVVLINFWASWCPPCVAELEEIQAVFDARSSLHEDFVVWAVNTRDERAAAEAFLDRTSYSFPFAYDPGDAAYEAFAPANFPALFLIDRTGRIRFTHVGYSRSENLEEHLLERIDDLLAEAPELARR